MLKKRNRFVDLMLKNVRKKCNRFVDLMLKKG